MNKREVPPEPATAAKPIYDALQRDIMSGKLTGGTPLRQDEIAKEHGVSKIPVREALLKLEADGYVLFRKNKGATVREMSVAEILNLMDIRIALECRALELAIPNQIQLDHIEAKRILDNYSEKNTVAGWSDMNRKFHFTLYEPCGNAQLLEMISDLQHRIGPAARMLVTETSGIERPSSEHKAILEACVERDQVAGIALLREHISTTKKEIAARLRRQPG